MTRRRAIWGGLLATLLGGCPPAAAPPAAGAPSAARGAALYARTCAACHGPTGEGVRGLGKDVTASAFARASSDAVLADFLAAGRPADHPENTTGVPMPPRGGDPSLTDADLRSLVLHLRALAAPE